MDHKKTPKWSAEKHSIEYDPDDFENSLPNLARELKEKTESKFIPIDGVHHEDIEETEEQESADMMEDANSNDDQGDDENPLPKKPQLNNLQRKLTLEEQRELLNPSVEDFLRRCRTRDECEQIITYMVKRKEIDHAKAEELKARIEKEGIHCFGSKKSWGYYERKYRNDTISE